MRRLEILLGLVVATLLGLVLGGLVLLAALVVLAVVLALIPLLLASALLASLLALVLIKTPAGPWLLERFVRRLVSVRWTQDAWRRIVVRAPHNGHHTSDGPR